MTSRHFDQPRFRKPLAGFRKSGSRRARFHSLGPIAKASHGTMRKSGFGVGQCSQSMALTLGGDLI